MQVVQIIKWVGYIDGAIVAGAMAFGKAAPQYEPIVDTVVMVGALITSVCGSFAHIIAGSQTVTPEQAAERIAAEKKAA